MKKHILFFLFLIIPLATPVYASGTNTEENNDLLYADLAPGETVVDFQTEPISENELVIKNFEDEIVLENDFKRDIIISPNVRSLTWYLKGKKSYVGLSYGSWKFAGASTISGGGVYLHLIPQQFQILILVN